jgi:hypothetical protein
VGRALCRRVFEEARADGYRAMQFNAVLETNTAAIRLWRSFGFQVLATVPEAFRHPGIGTCWPPYGVQEAVNQSDAPNSAVAKRSAAAPIRRICARRGFHRHAPTSVQIGGYLCAGVDQR